ncbi:replication initiator [Nonomuraea sp. NPDC004297]
MGGARLPSLDVVRALAEQAGVCVRPVPMWVADAVTGERRVVNVACGARLEAKCGPCARRARLARIVQCEEGWHLGVEPVRGPAAGEKLIKESAGTCPDDHEAGAGGGVRRVRSTRRRQDAPKLPRRNRRGGTLGRTFVGAGGRVYRPSMFVTLTLPSYGPVRDGLPLDPGRYDYVRAARDAVHFSRLVDRFVQNLRRVAGYSLQYFAVVEFQKRLAPHLHMAVRGTLARAELRQVVAATYHQVWWPAADRVRFEEEGLPVWRAGAGYVDPATGEVLPSWDEALDRLAGDARAVPLHVARFGAQVDMQGVLGGTADADQCMGYLVKYLIKSVSGGALTGDAGSARRRHVGRLLEALRFEPCTPGCANWLRYGVQPKDAKAGLVPGLCRGKAHRAEHLGYGGRRVLVSRRWSGKTLGEYAAERRAWVTAALGLEEEREADRLVWHVAKDSDPGVPELRVRVAELVTERQRLRRALKQASTDGAHGADEAGGRNDEDGGDDTEER